MLTIKHIYISPHNDDICFSLGHYASFNPGDIINLCTRSQYVASKNYLMGVQEPKINFVSQLRKDEDLSFIKALNLNRYDLGLNEPSLLGYGSRDLANISEAVQIVSDALLPLLKEILSPQAPRTIFNLYCPCGIGDHRDHVSTLLMIKNNLGFLSDLCRIYFYEDLPYASDKNVRNLGLDRLKNLFGAENLRPTINILNNMDVKNKTELMGLYKSQHRNGVDMNLFNPKSEYTDRVHEILWSL
jgi:hypothetical protein